MPVTTFTGDTEKSDGTGQVTVAAGDCFLGNSIEMQTPEINELKAEGRKTVEGPSASPGAPKLGAMALAEGGAGTPSGAYKYVVTYKTVVGETLASAELAITVTSKKIALSNIPLGPEGTTARKVYRTAASGASGTEKLVTEIANNTATTFEDNIADGSLGASLPATDTSSNSQVAEEVRRSFGWHQGT
jgi:hypothetical protein